MDDECAEIVKTLLAEAKADALKAIAAERERSLTEISERIGTRLNNHLCEMKEGYDDSITGFNEAWDIVRGVFAAAIRKGE